MYTAKEIKAMTNDEIVTALFYMGICCCNEKGTKSEDKALHRLFIELGKRGVISDPETCYLNTLK